MMTQRSRVRQCRLLVRKGPSRAQTGTVDDNVSNVTGRDGEGKQFLQPFRLKTNWIPRDHHDHYGPWHDRTNDQLDRDQCRTLQTDQAELQQLIASAVAMTMTVVIKSRSKALTLPKSKEVVKLWPLIRKGNGVRLQLPKGYLQLCSSSAASLTLFLVILMIVGVIRRRRKEAELGSRCDGGMVTFAGNRPQLALEQVRQLHEVVFGDCRQSVC